MCPRWQRNGSGRSSTSRGSGREEEAPPGEDFIGRHIEELTESLRSLTPEELIAFDRRFQNCRDLSYRWDLWGVAYWLHGGCSNDGFTDFAPA